MRLLMFVMVALTWRLAGADPLPDRAERVVGAGRVWAEVKFFHPWLGYKPIDWDAAFTRALPAIEAAKTTDEYRAALAAMLAALGDPATHVVAPAAVTPPPPTTGDWLTTPAPGIALVDLAGFTGTAYDPVGYANNAARVTAELAKATVVVIDLRVADQQLIGEAVSRFVDALPAIEWWPIERTIEHHGYWTQFGQTSGNYYSTFTYQGAQPAKPAPAKGPRHVVAIADRATVVPPALLALQAAGTATIIASTLAEENAVTTTKVTAAGVEVQLRVGELLWGAPVADVVATGDLRAKALAIAKRAATRQPAAPRPPKQATLPPYTPRYDADYAATPFPARELRVLAAIRAWAVLDRFWPYRYLAGDWDKALREALPKLEAATDQASYLAALRELGAKAGDGHINVWSVGGGVPQKGTAQLGLDVIEGKIAVTKVGPDVKGVAIGDVIETIDGKPAGAVLAERRATVSASTDTARDRGAVVAVLAGTDGTPVKVGIRDAANVRRELTLPRSIASWQLLYGAATPGPAWKHLANNLGYVDLRTLTVAEVEPMLKDLGGSKAIVFDMRGYPKGTAWTLAPRLNVKGARWGAQFLQPYVVPGGGFDVLGEQRVRFLQAIPPRPPGASLYRGKVIVLIDHEAISQSEHTCLFLQEAAGATFVGTPTAGANGDVTVMRLPGGVRMSFTGQEVRHVDGKQLQRVGIRPHLVVRPTLAGLRAHKDEVLERALVLATTGK